MKNGRGRGFKSRNLILGAQSATVRQRKEAETTGVDLASACRLPAFLRGATAKKPKLAQYIPGNRTGAVGRNGV